MGYRTKIQLIKRSKSEQWYINFPSALAKAMEFERGEVVEWTIEDKQKLILSRNEKVSDYDKKPQTDL
jgi:antitoxin component of MazEF toxin-antitoxin module